MKEFGAAINAAAGVIVVIVGLITLSPMTGYLVSSVNSDDAKLAIATTALGVIGTVIGAFFGVKAATDSRKDTQEALNDQSTRLSEVSGAAPEAAVRVALDRAEEKIAARS